MPYSTPDHVRLQWGKVLTTNLSPDEVARLIDDADGIIDAALARRYAVPFGLPPAQVIRTLSATFALLDIVDKSPTTADWMVRKLERAWKLLEQLASGDMLVPGATEITTTGGVQSSTSGYAPTFGAEPSMDEHVDWERQADEAAARGFPRVP